VAEESANNAGPFSVATVKALIQLMDRYRVDAIDLQQGEQRIRLRRGVAGRSVAVPVAAESPAATAPAPAQAAVAQGPSAGPALHEIKSELVGTFYSSREPGAEPFVRVGTRVNKGDVVCLIEAMKLFNEVPADQTGVIKEVCVQNQQPVEFGQVLFRLDPSA
jgi:acetyl-CoA carboxylase biotin carboxyl carrier protein